MTRFRACRDEHGFTMVEMMVATVIMISVTAATFTLMNPAQGMFAAQPEASDMQQRLRVGIDTLYKDLLMAGASTYSGPNTGSLSSFVAPIVPMRLGAVTPDAPGTFFTDRVTLMYVPPTAAQTTLDKEKKPEHPHLHVNKIPGCPKNDDLYCGFKEGMSVLIFDEAGQYDTFVVTGDGGDGGKHIEKKGQTLSGTFPAGSFVAQVVSRTYYLSTDTVAETYQLRQYDGYQTDVPIVDNVVGLTFEYFGEPQPGMLRPEKTPPTTYAPNPPALGVDRPSDSWGSGENCAFMVVAGQQVPRMETLAAGNAPLVKLDQTKLTDGPWCPDAAAANRYDVDLLRIRRIRATLRVQVANKAFRGPAGTLFTRAGTSQGGERFIPDREIKLDVTPRNLNLGR